MEPLRTAHILFGTSLSNDGLAAATVTNRFMVTFWYPRSVKYATRAQLAMSPEERKDQLVRQHNELREYPDRKIG